MPIIIIVIIIIIIIYLPRLDTVPLSLQQHHLARRPQETVRLTTEEQGSFLHEHARPLNKQFAWRLTTGSAFIKMAPRKQCHWDYFARWSWRMCSWFNKMCTLGSRGYFFLIDTDGWRRSRINEAQGAEEKELLISTGLFHLRYFEDGPLEPGCKCVVSIKKKEKKNSNMVSTKAKWTGFNIPRATSKFNLPTWPGQ